MKTVLLDISPLSSGHSLRGVGYYTKKLREYFLKIPNAPVESGLNIIFSKNHIPKERLDLIHYPFFDPFFLTLPLVKKAKTIVTVHDLIPLIFPDKYPKGLRGLLKWQIQRSSLLGCQAIITDSQNSKRDIEKITGFPKDNIFPVYLAHDEKFRKLNMGNWKEEVRRKLNIPENFILYVGDVNYNKNVPGLIKAFWKVKTKKELKNVKLVLVGGAFLKKDLPEALKITALIKNLNLEKDIIMPGQVTDEELVRIYNLAIFSVQPSFYEGFGLPVLEAMACGCPVISSDKSSLPEIVGDSAYYIDPGDCQSIAKAIREVIINKPLREKMIVKGLNQSKKFSWEKTINETIFVYKEILS